MIDSRNLSQLKIGQSATIENFSDNYLSLKLLEMGCLPGELVTLNKIAPMGDPLLITVSGYSLTLRKSEAETVMISSEGAY